MFLTGVSRPVRSNRQQRRFQTVFLRFVLSCLQLLSYSLSDSRSLLEKTMPSFSGVHRRHTPAGSFCIFHPARSLPAGAQTADSADREAGEAQYRLACAECHEGALLEAPQRSALALFPPERIVQSLESGIMATAGMALTREEKRQVAFFLTGQQATREPPP